MNDVETGTPPERELARIDAEIEQLFRLRREVLFDVERDAALSRPCVMLRLEDGVRAELLAPFLVQVIEFGRTLPLAVRPRLVRVRRTGKDEPTHLGIYVGDLPTGLDLSFRPRVGLLSLRSVATVPHIVVPALGEVLTGAECWWQALPEGMELTDLTDMEIAQGWAQLIRKAGL